MNISENMKLHQWAQAMADQKASGLTRQQWCDINDIPVSTFDYRCKKVRAAMEVKLKEKQNDSTVNGKINCTDGGADIFLDRISSFVLTLYDEFSEFFCLN